MRTFYLILLSVICLVSLGAGPCDEITSDDDNSSSEACGTSAARCNHSLDIDVMNAGGEPFIAGMYTFRVVAPDNSQYSIDCQLIRADADMRCSGPNTAELTANIDYTDPSVILFHVNGAPPSCAVSVFYNDVQLIQKVITPDYDLTYPNGEGCEPVCHSGEEAVAVQVL